MLTYVLKPKEAQQVQQKERIGYLQYGDVMVRPTATMADPLFFTHLMCVGGAGFLASDYVVVQADDLPTLVTEVQALLAGGLTYVLHGYPMAQDGKYRQTLLEWDPTIAVTRGRQVIGTFVAEHCASKHAGVHEGEEEYEEVHEGEEEDEEGVEGGNEGHDDGDDQDQDQEKKKEKSFSAKKFLGKLANTYLNHQILFDQSI